MIVNRVPSHHVCSPPLRIPETKHQIGLISVLITLLFIDVIEVVAKQDGMLFDVTCSEIQELLGCAPQVRQLTRKGLVVLNLRDQRNKSGGLLNGELIILAL